MDNIQKSINGLIKNKMPITVDNIVVNSLFLDTPEGTASDNEVKEYLTKLINIGFCQKKFYKASVWNNAIKLMNYLVSVNLVKAHDFGRGKGKYISELDTNEIIKAL